MITFANFNRICRLCLVENDERLVDVFSKLAITENIEGNDECLAEMIESFCSIKIRKGDGLPEHICNDCFDSVSSLYKLRILSHKSNRILCDIANSQNFCDESKSNTIEFIDTQLNIKKELLAEFEIDKNSLVDDLTDLTSVQHKIELNDPEVKKPKSKRKKIGGQIQKVSCEVCGKLVPNYFIEFHLNLHKDIRPYKCEVEGCDKYFVAPTHAKNHYTKVHINGIIRPYKCDICGSGFNQKSSLNTHKTYHFDPQIPCTICGQFYRNKRAIKKHLLVHSGERKYTCSECKKSFQTNSTLRVHLRTHTLEKPYACTDCPKSFAYKCLLKGHTAKYHPK